MCIAKKLQFNEDCCSLSLEQHACVPSVCSFVSAFFSVGFEPLISRGRRRKGELTFKCKRFIISSLKSYKCITSLHYIDKIKKRTGISLFFLSDICATSLSIGFSIPFLLN